MPNWLRAITLVSAVACFLAAALLVLHAGLPQRAEFTVFSLDGGAVVAPETGAIAPPIDNTPTLAGDPIAWDALRGQPVIVNFWATWCVPCRVEMPELQALYDEVKAFREACGDAHLKAILATGELGTLRNVYRASAVCMMAGADFIKTSTGKEKVNATLPVSLAMVRAIREHYELTGHFVGYKPAGGISTAKDALAYLVLMKEELGDRWLRPDLFRFGASSLLGDIERQLEHHVTGRYSASFRHPMA